MPVVVVLSTFPSEDKAAEIGRVLVDEHLCACVNLVPRVRSIYRWRDEICDEAEALAIIKTTPERVDELRDRLVSLHPYEVPEVIALPASGGHAAYLDWVAITCSR
jgi:periplasmic divalent cation tolerance protein